MKKQNSKRKRWLIITVTSAVGMGCCARLAGLWFESKKIGFVIFWDTASPIWANLRGYEWGVERSITDHPDDDKPGYIDSTSRCWRVGPFAAVRELYHRL